ncbi:MAG: DUF2520 domain-containing protein [Bacteroidales bacterium]|nr:DUF2520 domain-containing protein [Bacteroidales bacterium]
MIPFNKIALIGTGNVAYAYSKALKNNGILPSYIYTRFADKIHEVEKSFGLKATCNLGDLLDCDLIIIAVKDDAICDVASGLKNFKGLLVHTSGTKPSSILNHIENYGVLYPLQTLTKDFDVDFKSVPLLINASSSNCLKKLKHLANIMSDVVVECSDEDRGAIHLSAVFVCNFVNVMLQIGDKLLENKGVDVSVFESLVKETVDKAFALGPKNALTGPAKRGDFETIEKHNKLLENNIDEKKIYEILTNYIINKCR